MKLGLKQKVFSRIGTKIGGLGQLGLKHTFHLHIHNPSVWRDF